MKCCKTDKEIVFNEVQNQFLTVACANLMAMAHGGVMGWTSMAASTLESPDSPVGKLSKEEISWIASISYIGAFVGTIFFIFIIKFLGRRNTFLILAVPNFMFWLAVVFAKHVGILYAARFIGGTVGGGAYISIPLLVAEISEDHVRGMLGSMLMVFVNVGIMVSYLAGAYMNYHTAPYVMMVFPIGVFLSFLFIPDTPMSLLERKKPEAAIEKSLKFYLNIKDMSIEGNQTRYESALKLVHAWVEKKQNSEFSVKDLFAKDALLGFVKALAIVFFSIFCGSPILNNYSAEVFKESGSNLDAKLSAVIMITIQVSATIVAAMFVDNLGRRMLLIISCIGTCMGLTIMGTFNYLSLHGDMDLSNLNWIPIGSISFTVLLAYTGLLPLVFVVIMEVLPPKVRESYATICLSCVSLFMFIVVKLWPSVMDLIGLYGGMWFFALMTLLAIFFAIFVLEETKGKDINEIDES